MIRMYQKRRIALFPLFLILLIMLTGCSDDGGSVTVSGSQTVDLYAVTNQSTTLTFTADGSWKASCDASWLNISPREGGSGTNTITLSTTATNQTKHQRSAQLVITSGSAKKTITVRQRGDYALFRQSDYSVPATGATLNIKFVTNLSANAVGLYATQGINDWVVGDSQADTRAENEGRLKALRVLPNTSKEERVGAFFLVMFDSNGEAMPLDTLWIHQAAASAEYESVDYSADGRISLMAKGTEGKAIPIVVMGDGFVGTDIADSTYYRVMERAVDNMFSEEPIRSLKQYFNIWCVTTVSRHAQFGDGYETALSSKPSYNTSSIETNENVVRSYVMKAVPNDIDRALAVVVINSTRHNGVTYLFSNARKEPADFAIALCAMVDGIDSDVFRLVITHEAIGHGLAKLGDEYVNPAYGSATDDDIASLKWHHRYNWFMNVDSESDATKTIWSAFVDHQDYTNEQIGAYEGAYTFYKGVFRPTDQSMMNSNDSPFNAPSRQAIYNRVMKMAFGETPSTQDFMAFDHDHKPTVWSYDIKSQTRNAWSPQWQSCIRWGK